MGNKNKLKKLLGAGPNPIESKDPSSVKRVASMSPELPLLTTEGKRYRLIGNALGATVPIPGPDGKTQYLRLDSWEAIIVPDDPKIVERERKQLRKRLRDDLQLQQQEAIEELMEDDDDD